MRGRRRNDPDGDGVEAVMLVAEATTDVLPREHLLGGGSAAPVRSKTIHSPMKVLVNCMMWFLLAVGGPYLWGRAGRTRFSTPR